MPRLQRAVWKCQDADILALGDGGRGAQYQVEMGEA